MDKITFKTKNLVYCALLVAAGMMLSWVETLIPLDFGIAGVKLGLANMAVLIALYIFDVKHAFAVAVVRIILSSTLFTGVLPMFYSLAGGIFSLCGMFLLKKSCKFGIVAVSACGGVLHNFGQIIVAICFFGVKEIIFYMPLLAVSGVVTGVLVGVVSSIVIKRLKK